MKLYGLDVSPMDERVLEDYQKAIKEIKNRYKRESQLTKSRQYLKDNLEKERKRKREYYYRTLKEKEPCLSGAKHPTIPTRM